MVGQNQKAPVKLSSVVNASRYVPSTSQSSLIVGVRVRPLLKSEHTKGNRKDIIRVLDSRVVVVLDPDESKDYLDQVQNRTKEKRYTFDIAFDVAANNQDVFNGTLRDLVAGVLYGINTTVFAYGATGSGKTYTMVGTPNDPGLMVLSLQRIFQDRDRFFKEEEFEVTCTYLEVYNEVIYDLLVKNSSALELREDPEQGVCVAGLRAIGVKSAEDILGLLEEGNKRRKTEATDANAQSSRSHAVLEIAIRRQPKNHYRVQQLKAKLALVDLAGSERAAETNNAGQKLRDGANINRSLLALANCINALGKMAAPGAKGGAAYVPYRNSKLTRLLKDGLSGNSRTAMIATVAAASDQYHHSINTLKYADRAKEIKTHVVQNVGTVESHIADYQRIIDTLQQEVQDLKSQLSDRLVVTGPVAGSMSGGAAPTDEVLGLIDSLVQDMNENIEERINLQKALFEIEDANLFNRYELRQLDEFLEAGQGGVKDIAEARDRRSDIQAAIRDNDRELTKFKAEIVANEGAKKELQGRIDTLVNSNSNANFLNLISTFRLQAVRLQELKFQMAVRDQIISEQREVISNLWRIIDKSGLGRQKVLDIAKAEGIIMDGFLMPLDTEAGRPNTAEESAAAHSNGQAMAGLIAASDVHGATPNASLAGNRAKMRYKFWTQYHGEGDDDTDGQESPGKKGKGKGANALPSASKRKGAGIRVEHVAHLHPPAHGRRRRGTHPSYPGGGTQEVGGSGAPSPSAASSGTSNALASAAAAAIAARGNASNSNATVPTIRSGRRAGQPAGPGHRRTTSDELGDAEGAGNFHFDLPRPAYGAAAAEAPAQWAHQRPSDDGNGIAPSVSAAIAARRRSALDQISAAAAGAGRPPAPPAQAPLNERLAKLKGRLGRKTEGDGNMDGIPAGGQQGDGDIAGLAVAGVGYQAARAHREPDPPPQPSSAPTPPGVISRQPSRAHTPPGSAPGGGDSLDQHVQSVRRLSSAGSQAAVVGGL